MKTTKSFAGNLCLCLFILIATCACSNTPKTTKEAESTTETTKEEGTIFFDLTLEEALKKAKAENKFVLINFHSTYCAPCKKMKKYGKDYKTNCKVQIRWGLDYIKRRYKT